MPKAEVNGVQLHYQQSGTGDDVVLVHGLTGNLSVWYRGFTPRLRKQFRVTCYDLRGHGYSDAARDGYTSRAMAGDLLALLDHLGIGQAHLVGHSFGGLVALHAAVLCPERVRTVVMNDSDVPALKRLVDFKAWPGWEVWGDKLAERGIYPQDDYDPIELMRISYDVPVKFGFRKGQKRKTACMERLLNETAMPREFRQEAGLTEASILSLEKPVLAVYGETSPFLVIGRHLERNLSCCRLVTLEQEGHFYVMQPPPAFLEVLCSFLKDAAEPGGHARPAR